jgi:type I restriction enzyme, R subunit
VDWTEPHRDDVRAAISTAVKRVSRRRDVREEDFEPVIHRFMEQAQALYADWPLAA